MMESQIRMQAGTRLIAGTILIVAGGVLGLSHSGLLNAVEVQRSWPLVLIAASIVQLTATIHNPRQRGWGLLLLGDWLFLNTMTDWAYQQFAWPLLLTGVGAWVIAAGMNRAKRSSSTGNPHAT